MSEKNADITISRLSGDGESIRVSIRDRISSQEVVEIELTLEDFALALTGRAHTQGDARWRGLDRVGKRMEMEKWEFELPASVDFTNEKEAARAIATSTCKSGWTPDTYFNSQNSFFTLDGKRWARTTIRRWVSETEHA